MPANREARAYELDRVYVADPLGNPLELREPR
jgi:hypothetical protein